MSSLIHHVCICTDFSSPHNHLYLQWLPLLSQSRKNSEVRYGPQIRSLPIMFMYMVNPCSKVYMKLHRHCPLATSLFWVLHMLLLFEWHRGHLTSQDTVFCPDGVQTYTISAFSYLSQFLTTRFVVIRSQSSTQVHLIAEIFHQSLTLWVGLSQVRSSHTTWGSFSEMKWGLLLTKLSLPLRLFFVLFLPPLYRLFASSGCAAPEREAPF